MRVLAVYGNTADDRGAVRAGDDGGDTLAGCHARAGFRPEAADHARSDLDRGGCDRVGRVPRRLLVQPRRGGDRESVVLGTWGEVRLNRGGLRVIKKQKK